MPNLLETEAQQRAAVISDLSYDVTLAVSDDPAAATFDSRTRIDFALSADGDTFLDLEASRVRRLRVNGADVAAADIDFNDGRLRLRGLQGGRVSVEVDADCEYQHNGVGMHRRVDPADGRVYLYTHFEPFDAHKVFACFDQPDLKARFTTHVVAPAQTVVCSNGRTVGTTTEADGRTRWDFNTTPLLPTYLVALVQGDYVEFETVHRGIRLRVLCRRSLSSYLDAQKEDIFEATRAGLDFYEREFGFAYPFDEYTQIFVPEANMGAMENPNCVTFNELYIHRGKATETQLKRRYEVILHEMAHVHGFGDVTTMKWWADLWLNETFATYMASKALFEATRFRNAWVDFANTTKSAAARQDQLPTTHPIAAIVPDTDSVRLNFDGITYHKGASVMRQLAAWVGEDAFMRGVRDYFQRHMWANATLDDFLGALERASGRDLRQWSREWLQTTGMNTLRPVASVQNGRYTSFSIEQTAAPDHPTLRHHRVGIGLYRFNADGDLVLARPQLQVDISGGRTAIDALRGEEEADLVVVNDSDLTFAKLRFDERSLATLRDRLSSITDPLTRSLCWAALWDMTRDAEMRSRDFVDVVMRHAPAETDVTIVERLIPMAVSAIDNYGDPANRRAARTALSGVARRALLAAQPGSDLQLTWMRSLVQSAERPRDLRFLEEILDGSVTVQGLAVDIDLRWSIVGRLASAGYPSAAAASARIDAEAQRDRTDFGERRAATCRAAIPSAAAKRAAWNTLVNDRSLPLATQMAIAGGLWQPDARSVRLTRAYISHYAQILPRLWRERSEEEARRLTGALFPSVHTDPEVIEVADRALADAQLPLQAKRIILEARDTTLRMQRGRSVDAGPPVQPSPGMDSRDVA